MSLEFRHIAHAYGEVEALRDVSFTAPAAEITCLLGSSGCGKSTLLNLAAGLLPVQHGSVHVAGEIMAQAGTNPPPEVRGVGLVFQDGALFPHMSIAANIAFGMEQADPAVIDTWLDQVGLSGLGARFPHELSGGQQQRAALARAMAPEPDVLLMDEPFASVDIVLRRRLRRDCRMLLKQRGTTTVLVTHDPEEALDIGDRIAVMEAGRIVQFGTPHDLHQNPAAASVGAIFGGAQVVQAVRQSDSEGDLLRTAFGAWPVSCVVADMPDTSDLDLLIYAEKIELVPAAATASSDGLEVRDVHPIGAMSRVLLASPDEQEITALTDQAIDPSARYLAVPQAGSIRAFVRT